MAGNPFKDELKRMDREGVTAPQADQESPRQANAFQEELARLPENAPLTGAENFRGAARAALNGALLEWGDELSAGLGSIMGATSGYGEGDTWNQRRQNIYDDIHSHEKAAQERYEEDNGGKALGYNLAGSLITAPISVGGKVLQGASKAGGLLKGLSGAKTAGNAGKGSGVFKQYANRAAELMADGAVAGAGSAEEGERLGGATAGAATSAALGGLTRSLKGAINQGTKRRIAKDLDTPEGFMSINLAADRQKESNLQNFYQESVGRSFGKGGVINPTNEHINKQVSKIGEHQKDASERLFKKALPEAMKNKKLDLNDPSKNIADLEDYWKSDEAYQVVKNRDFRINDREIIEEIMGKIDDPALERNKGEVYRHLQEGLSDKLKRDEIWDGKYKFNSKGMNSKKTDPIPQDTGTITGRNLMDARNRFRTEVNSSKLAENNPSLARSVSAKSAETIDDVIKKQLSKKERNLYEDDLKNYSHARILKKAMEKASKAGENLPTVRQIHNAAQENTPKMASTLRGAGQREAFGDVQNLNKMEGVLKDYVDRSPAEPPLANQIYQTKAAALPYEAAATAAGISPNAMGMLLGGGANMLGAGTQTGQRFVAGQTPVQKGIQSRIERYRGSQQEQALNTLGTILRRQAAMGAGE